MTLNSSENLRSLWTPQERARAIALAKEIRRRQTLAASPTPTAAGNQILDLPLLPLRPDQWRIVTHPAKEKIIAMGRRWGKTTMAGSLSVATANEGWPVAWIVPTYKNARPVWRFIESMTRSFADRISSSKSDMVVKFPSGGWFGVYTADNPVGVLGEAFKLVVGEEAARWPDDVYEETIRPTLADMDGESYLISTPRGMNWFARKFFAGQNDGKYSASFTAPSSANPIANIQKAYQRIKQLVERGEYSPRTFKQEWEAEFLSDGSYFQHIDECCILLKPDQPGDHAGHTFGLGIDWGDANDWTRGTIGCRECDRVVDWFGFTGIGYINQRGRIIEYAKKWPNVRVLPERNSIGTPNIELLRRAGLSVALGPDNKHGFQTTATTKPTLIEQLALSLQRGKKYPKEYADEFRAFEVTTGANGNPKFSAPDGMHDDRVISAALENWLSISAIQVF